MGVTSGAEQAGAAVETSASEAGVRRLIEGLRCPGEGRVVKQLSAMAGLPHQTVWVALLTLEQLALVAGAHDPITAARLWKWVSDIPALQKKGPVPVGLVTLAEAAELAGRSLKSLQSRSDRGTLRTDRPGRPGRRRYVSLEALQIAGLLEGGGSRGMALQVRQLIRTLAPGTKEHTVAELVLACPIRRQTAQTVLTTLRCLGYVERSYDPGFKQNLWRWSGPSLTSA